MDYRRTTVVLEESLYRQAKRRALERDKTLKELIEEALRTFLRGGKQAGEVTKGPRFGVYPGKPLTDLRRETIYRHVRK